MFRQGDRERALGQPISPLMDRTKGGVTKSQTGFFNIVAMPMYMVSCKDPDVHGKRPRQGTHRRSEAEAACTAECHLLIFSCLQPCIPLLQAFAEVFPEAAEMLKNLKSNLEMWAEAEAAAVHSNSS